jgi:hypothetical protein
MIDYNDYVQYQNNLNKALEVLEENTSTNNYCEEAKELLKSLMTYRDIYKKKYGENEYVLVGKLTSKNEILFDIPIESDLVTNKNKSRSIRVYCPEWYYIELNEKVMRYVPIAEEEITNKISFNQITYPSNGMYNNTVLGYSMGDWRCAEVVFYDQYIRD